MKPTFQLFPRCCLFSLRKTMLRELSTGNWRQGDRLPYEIHVYSYSHVQRWISSTFLILTYTYVRERWEQSDRAWGWSCMSPAAAQQKGKAPTHCKLSHSELKAEEASINSAERQAERKAAWRMCSWELCKFWHLLCKRNLQMKLDWYSKYW